MEKIQAWKRSENNVTPAVQTSYWCELKVIRSPSFIRPAMFDLELEWTLAPIYFSPQPFAVIKIKDGSHEVTKHSLAKITPALQAAAATFIDLR